MDLPENNFGVGGRRADFRTDFADSGGFALGVEGSTDIGILGPERGLDTDFGEDSICVLDGGHRVAVTEDEYEEF